MKRKFTTIFVLILAVAVTFLMVPRLTFASFASRGSMGTGTSKVDGTTVAISSTAQTANATDLVVVIIASDNVDTTDVETTHWSCVDSTGGNTYTRIGEYVNGEAAANAGVQVSLFYSRLATQLASGGSITCTTDSTTVAKQIRGWRFTTGNTVSVQTSATPANADQASPPSMAISSLTEQQYLFFRAGAIESDNSVGTYSTTSGFTSIPRSGTSGGGEQSNVSTYGEFIITTATGATSDPNFSGGTSRDNSNWFVALKEDAAAGGGATTNTPRAIVRGQVIIQGQTIIQ